LISELGLKSFKLSKRISTKSAPTDLASAIRIAILSTESAMIGVHINVGFLLTPPLPIPTAAAAEGDEANCYSSNLNTT
jgi:hypothetical protein